MVKLTKSLLITTLLIMILLVVSCGGVTTETITITVNETHTQTIKVTQTVESEVDFNIIPSVGNYIPNSEIWLQYVHIEKVLSDKQYFASWYPLHTVNEGELIIEVSGSIQNKHPQYEYITMYAEGYDETGEQVAWTLDDAHIAGQIGLYLKNEETSEFTLHLNFSDNMKTIHIFANVYGLPPP